MSKNIWILLFLFIFILFYCSYTFGQPELILEDVSTLSSPFFKGRLSGTLGAARAADYLSYRFKALGLEPFHFDSTYTKKVLKKDFLHPFYCVLDSSEAVDSVQCSNVIGVIFGKHPTLKKEYLVIGAHYDHLGFGGKLSFSKSRDSLLHPGADDNASGVAALLSIAYQLKTKSDSLSRSIIFAAFDAEEWNAQGSTFFVKRLEQHSIRVIAMINLDMVGRLDSLHRLIVYGTATSPQWDALLEKHNSFYRFELNRINDSFGAGDHLPFYRRSIPVLFFFTGAHTDYHRPSDVAEKINHLGIEKLSNFVSSIVVDLSQYKEPFVFTAVSEKATKRRSNQFNAYVGVIPDFKNSHKGFALLGASEHSPAHHAGVQMGDIMIEFDGKPIQTLQDYMAILDQHHPGDEVNMVVLRDNQPITLKIVIGMR